MPPQSVPVVLLCGLQSEVSSESLRLQLNISFFGIVNIKDNLAECSIDHCSADKDDVDDNADTLKKDTNNSKNPGPVSYERYVALKP